MYAVYVRLPKYNRSQICASHAQDLGTATVHRVGYEVIVIAAPSVQYVSLQPNRLSTFHNLHIQSLHTRRFFLRNNVSTCPR